MTGIAITGACGKMGRVIAGLVEQRSDCKVVAGIDLLGEKYADFPVYKKVFDLAEKPDVIIDFSHPSALPDLLSYGKMNNVPLVLATTGYTDEERSQITAAASQIPVFFTFNMSLGINLLVEQGILYKRRGIGMFVAPGAGQAVRASRQAAFYKRFVCPMVKEAAGLGLTVQQLNEMVARAAEEVKQ